MQDNFSHLDKDGNITMVDVGAKPDTQRVAIAEAIVELSPNTLKLLKECALPKGDVLTCAKVGGIMAAKRTSELIPLCHPLNLNLVDVRFEVRDTPPSVRIEAETRTTGPTGVEMEAIIAAQTAAAVIYDMCKAVQRDIVISRVRLLFKDGGRSGALPRQAPGLRRMQFPAIDPVAFSIGSLQLRWYGLMYLLAFFVGWGLARWAGLPSRFRLEDRGCGRPADLRHAGRHPGRAPGLCALLRSARLHRRPRRDPAHLERRHVLPRRPAGRALRLLVFRAHPQEVLPRGLGLHRAAGAARPVLGPHGQLHQRRALGQGQRRALGHGLPHRRALAAPPLAAL